MGTMERMRQTSPYILAAFAIMFVGFMVLSDADISSALRKGENYQTSSIAKVNGEKILYKEFETRVREQLEQQRKQMQAQGMETQDIDDLQIRRTMWSEMIDNLLLTQQANAMGVFVSKDELLDILYNEPPDFLRKPFTDSAGVFQRQSYIDIISNPEIILSRLPEKMSAEEKRNVVNTFRGDLYKVQKAMEDERLRNGLNTVVNTSLSIVSPLYAKEKFQSENSVADMNYLAVEIKDVADAQVNVNDEEIKTYYEKYKTLWPTKPKRRIKYVNFALVPSTADTAIAVKALKKIEKDLTEAPTPEDKIKVFNKRMGEFKGESKEFSISKDIPENFLSILSPMKENDVVGPVALVDGTYFIRLDGRRSGENFTVKASHILLEFGANKDSSKAEAMKILKEAKTGDFAELARKYSSDKGSAQTGGDVGYFTKGKMVKPFEEAAFAASKGQVVGPVESQFGWHIIKVDDKQSDEIKYSFIKIKPELTRLTTKALGRDAKEFKDKVEAGENFDALAKKFNKIPRQTDFFEKEKPVLGSQSIALKAFELNVGKVLEPFDLKNYGIVVVQVTDQRQAGLVPLEDMKDKIKAKLIVAKKLDFIKSKAEAIFNRVKSFGSLANAMNADPSLGIKNAAQVRNNGVIPGYGQDIALTSAAFNLPIMKMSELIRGERGYYIVELTNKQVPDENIAKAAMKDYVIQLRNQFKSGGYYQWFQQVRDDANIEDNRLKYFNEF